MSAEIVPTETEATVTTLLDQLITSPSTWPDETQLNSTNDTPVPEYHIAKNVHNTTAGDQSLEPETSPIEAFIIIEIVMTTLELVISILAVLKLPGWKKNYRNQMLMQLSLARFIKRVVFYARFLKNGHVPFSLSQESTQEKSPEVLFIVSLQIYIDFVIVVLVVFFIKHMYDSLIVVLVKISQNNLYKVIICSWLLPIPVSAAWVAVLATRLLDGWLVYLLVCAIFRWPLILLGTLLYIAIVYRVLRDQIRQFARSLAIITFFLCLVINLYLFSADVIVLWCVKSILTIYVKFALGFLLNLLILIMYIVLIILNYKHKNKCSNSVPNHSVDSY